MDEDYKKRFEEIKEKARANFGEPPIQPQVRTGDGGSIAISTTISRTFWDLAKQHRISWAEAMRVGLSVIFGDLGIREYDNNLNLHRKMKGFQKIAEESTQKLHELMGQLAEKEGFKFEHDKNNTQLNKEEV